MNIVLPSSAQSSQRLLNRRTLGDILRRAPKPEQRPTLDSFFLWRRGLPPEHLAQIFAYLSARPWPFAKWDGSGFLSHVADTSCQPGAYRKPSREGPAKIMVIGDWKKGRFAKASSDKLQLRNLPRECHTFTIPGYYAHILGLEREIAEGPNEGKRYAPTAVHNALATLLLLRVGATPAPALFEDAVARFSAFADEVFGLVKAGKLRVEGAFALFRVLEVLHRLQQVHTWMRNDGAVQPSPLSRWFVAGIQHECAEDFDELREAFNTRCRWYALNLALSAKAKRDLPASKYCDSVTYPTSKRRQGEALLEQAGEGFDKYWLATLSPDRWYQLIKQAQEFGFIERVGRAEHNAREEDEDEFGGRASDLWSLKALGVPWEHRARHTYPAKQKP